MDSYDLPQERILAITVIATAILSLVGSGSIIGGSLLLPKQMSQLLHTRLVVALSWAGVGAALNEIVMIPLQTTGPIPCALHAFGTSFFYLAAVLWTCCLAFHIHMSIINSPLQFSMKIWHYRAFSWGISLAVSLMPFAVGAYGKEASFDWCWMTEDHPVWMFSTFYVEVFLGWLYNLFMFIHVRKVIFDISDFAFRHNGGNPNALRVEAVKKLRFYPLIFLIIWLVPLVSRVVSIVLNRPVFWLTLAHGISAASQGFLNALVFGRCMRKHFEHGCILCCTQDDGVNADDPLLKTVRRDTSVQAPQLYAPAV